MTELEKIKLEAFEIMRIIARLQADFNDQRKLLEEKQKQIEGLEIDIKK